MFCFEVNLFGINDFFAFHFHFLVCMVTKRGAKRNENQKKEKTPHNDHCISSTFRFVREDDGNRTLMSVLLFVVLAHWAQALIIVQRLRNRWVLKSCGWCWMNLPRRDVSLCDGWCEQRKVKSPEANCVISLVLYLARQFCSSRYPSVVEWRAGLRKLSMGKFNSKSTSPPRVNSKC